MEFLDDRGSNKLYKIIIKHSSIPFKVCPSIPVLVELDTSDDTINGYEVKIQFLYKPQVEEPSEMEIKVEPPVQDVNSIFKAEMKKQSDLDNFLTPTCKHFHDENSISQEKSSLLTRRGDELYVNKGDSYEEIPPLDKIMSPQQSISEDV